MSDKVLQINLRFNLSAAELEKEFETVASHIAAVPGLKWKIFGMNEERSEGAGIYLFEDGDSLKSYLEGPIVAGLKANKAFSDSSDPRSRLGNDDKLKDGLEWPNGAVISCKIR